MNKLEELVAWKKARELRKMVSKLADKFPEEEKFRLKDQILRSSRSVAANIAEGFGRFHYLENIKYCRNARGSLIETQEHIYCALDEGLIDQTDFDTINHLILEELKIVNGLMNYLKKAKLNSEQSPLN